MFYKQYIYIYIYISLIATLNGIDNIHKNYMHINKKKSTLTVFENKSVPNKVLIKFKKDRSISRILN